MYEEAAKKYNEQTKSQQDARRATAELEAAQAELGNAIEPVTTKFTQLKTKGLSWLIDKGLPAAKNGFKWIKDNLAPVATLVAGVTTAIIAQNTANKIKLATDKAAAAGTTLLKIAQEGLNATFKANSIGLVITGITLLVTSIMYLWKNCEGFRNFIKNMWAGIKSGFSAAVSWISNACQNIGKFFSDLWTGIKKTFSSVGTWFTQKFSEAYNGITNVFSKIGTFFSGIWSTISTTFSGLGTTIGNAISGAVKTAVNGVISSIESRINDAIGLINGAIDLANKLPGVNVGHVRTVSFPRLAQGGIVSQATTAVIGEDGKEAIVPLERNLEWIDKVADKVAEKMGNSKGGNVVVNQTNNYSQAHSRYELYKSKQQTAAAVRLAMQGG